MKKILFALALIVTLPTLADTSSPSLTDSQKTLAISIATDYLQKNEPSQYTEVDPTQAPWVFDMGNGTLWVYFYDSNGCRLPVIIYKTTNQVDVKATGTSFACPME